jgi:hypothetical protein
MSLKNAPENIVYFNKSNTMTEESIIIWEY